MTNRPAHLHRASDTPQRDADVLAYVLAGITATDADAAAVDRLRARARPNSQTPNGPTPSRRTTPPKNTVASNWNGHNQSGRQRSGGDGTARNGTGRQGSGRNRSGHRVPNGQPADRTAPHGRPANGQAPDLWANGTPPNNQPAHDTAPHGQPANGHAPNQWADGQPPDQWANSDACDQWADGEACDQWADGDISGVERHLPPAQVSVLIGLDALRGHTDEMGLTDAGTELPPEVVRGLCCDAEIIPVILGGPGGPADVGRLRRTVPRRLRRLLIARDRRCRWPGCHAPPSRCDAHHIWHWSKGGPTNLDNLVLLCHRHHHYLHEHGYDMVPQPDGTWTVTQETEPDPTPQQSPAQARAP